MDNAEAISILTDLVTTASQSLQALTLASTLIQAAQAEGRELTAAEWQQLRTADEAARKKLEDALG